MKQVASRRNQQRPVSPTTISAGQAMTKAEIEAWRERWRVMNELEVEDLRSTPPEICLQQLEAMYASVDAFGACEALAAGADEVRARWNRLKDKYGVRRR